ncbi:MAG: hypothetical protein ABUS56_08235, partial [Acidobacteriota bacterium]
MKEAYDVGDHRGMGYFQTRIEMKNQSSRNWLTFVLGGIIFAGALALGVARPQAGGRPQTAAQADAAKVAIDPDDIGGVVASAAGPEAGVWVIADTKDLGTQFRKIVVT